MSDDGDTVLESDGSFWDGTKGGCGDTAAERSCIGGCRAVGRLSEGGCDDTEVLSGEDCDVVADGSVSRSSWGRAEGGCSEPGGSTETELAEVIGGGG